MRSILQRGACPASRRRPGCACTAPRDKTMQRGRHCAVARLFVHLEQLRLTARHRPGTATPRARRGSLRQGRGLSCAARRTSRPCTTLLCVATQVRAYRRRDRWCHDDASAVQADHLGPWQTRRVGLWSSGRICTPLPSTDTPPWIGRSATATSRSQPRLLCSRVLLRRQRAPAASKRMTPAPLRVVPHLRDSSPRTDLTRRVTHPVLTGRPPPDHAGARRAQGE